MNRNTRSRKVAQRKANKAAGFPKPVFKKKSKPFPRPNKDDMSLANQRQIFYGI